MFECDYHVASLRVPHFIYYVHVVLDVILCAQMYSRGPRCCMGLCAYSLTINYIIISCVYFRCIVCIHLYMYACIHGGLHVVSR